MKGGPVAWNIDAFPNFKRWMDAMKARPAVGKVLSVMNRKEVKSEGRVERRSALCLVSLRVGDRACVPRNTIADIQKSLLLFMTFVFTLIIRKHHELFCNSECAIIHACYSRPRNPL